MTNPENHNDEEASADVTTASSSFFVGRPWLLPTITGVGGFVLGSVVLGLVLLIAGAVGESNRTNQAAEAEAARATILPAALAACGLRDDSDTEIGDGGYSLTVNNKGKDDVDGIDYTDLSCLIGALNAPTSVSSHMEQTTSMDGRQTESWDVYEASWSYHPDRGMDAVFTIEK